MSLSDKKVNLVLKGKPFLVNYDILKISSILSDMINESLFEDNNIPSIPIFNIEPTIFENILSFLENYLIEPIHDIPKPMTTKVLSSVVQPFYASLVFNDKNDLNNDQIMFLIELLKAANFLGIKPLIELCSYKIAIIITELPIEKVKEIFGFNDNSSLTSDNS